MINHFSSEQAAISHLISRGFKQRTSDLWVARGGVIARLINDPHRGYYIHFIVGEEA